MEDLDEPPSVSMRHMLRRILSDIKMAHRISQAVKYRPGVLHCDVYHRRLLVVITSVVVMQQTPFVCLVWGRCPGTNS